MNRPSLIQALLLALLLSAPLARAADYVVFSVSQPFSAMYPMSRNAGGDVAGTWLDSGFRNHGFVRRASGEVFSFDVPSSGGLVETRAVVIGDDGTVSGYYTELDANGQPIAQAGFRRAPNGTFSFFSVPGADATYVTGASRAGELIGYVYHVATDTVAGYVASPGGGYAQFDAGVGRTLLPYAINDLGEVTGTLDFNQAFFRRSDGTLDTFKAPGRRGQATGTEFSLTGLNNQGTAVGSATQRVCLDLFHCYALNLRAIVRQRDGSFSDFQVNGRPTAAVSINNGGDIAGSYYLNGVGDNGPPSGFIRSIGGAFITYNVPGMSKTNGGLIGDDGVVLGNCSDASGKMFGYLRTP